jgi:hypothetical protein
MGDMSDSGALTAWQQEMLGHLLDTSPQRVTLNTGRAAQSGKRYATWLAIREAIARGEVVHAAAPGRVSCTQPGHCDLPAWDGEG